MPDPVTSPSVVQDVVSSRHPQSCVQHGIHKPKAYTDGYGHLSVSSEEPMGLRDALSNYHGKAAMDSKYLALMKIKTWHLIPPCQGKNIIDCNGFVKFKVSFMVPLIDIKHILLVKGLNKDMRLIMRTPLA